MTRALKITRSHATGNDFVLFADPAGEINSSAEKYARLARPLEGGGNVDVIRAIRSGNLPEGRALLTNDPDAEWFMDHRHRDGSTATACGNALRVFVAYLLAEKLVSLTNGDRIAIATRDGVKDVQVGAGGMFRVDLGRWRSNNGPREPRTGVIFVDPTSDVRGPIRVEPLVPLVDDGIGRIRLSPVDGAQNDSPSWAIAAVSAALSTRHREGSGAPHHWRVDMPGGSLGVQMFPTEDGEHVSISGFAEILDSGEIQI